ncbi:pyridoxal 5'-phosphate synthase [Malassezia cuniculi]|uniref:pyridoxal 5'-phosphate synthase n=1 Tax=Malassezia cuniculi TaxID=948313 RepID=A0AAF0EP24_9BASI|nr:pyridoxal 5'-phosphate synthase [Malassezia cuniculi]
MLVTTRSQYNTEGLDVHQIEAEPMAMFGRWFDDAHKADELEPEAMNLSTVALPGAPAPGVSSSSSSSADKSAWPVDAPRPSSRIVLLKHADARGFQFFSNYDSRKGNELDANPWCALTFFWPKLHRSVRVLGRVERLSPEESKAYYDTRPVGSRIGAWASPQSRVIADRAELDRLVRDTEQRFATSEEDIPLPPHWGGYRVVPDEVEFWMGRPNRLHDRIRYVRDPNTPMANDWSVERLAP